MTMRRRDPGGGSEDRGTGPGRALVRYASATGAVVLATLAVALLWTGSARNVPSLFVAAVLLSTWRGGLGPGLLATALSVAVMEYVFEPPFYTVAVEADDVVRAAAFVGACLVVSSLGTRQRRAEARLQRLNEELERRVEERTREVSRTAELLRAELIEQDRAEQTRAALEDRLRQAEKMEVVGQLTGGVAHDFDNLLTVILGNVDRLEEELGESRPDLARMATQAVGAARRGAELTHRLLAFARRQPLQPRAVDLAQLGRNLQSLLGRTLGESIQVRTEVGPDLWPARADPGQVESAILNIAVNARDAMPRGGILTIEVANAELNAADLAGAPEVAPGPYVVVAVSDTGTGMAPEVRARAFEPFFTTKEVGKGSGLGLSMVYGFARQSGGHVTITSAVARGTTVRLYLPVATEAPAPESRGPRPDLPSGRETILVVEDEPSVRELVRVFLEGLGYHVRESESAAAALTRLEAGDPVDLLFTDVGLPGGMSGLDLGARAHALRPGLKVLYTSGYPPETTVPGDAPDLDVEILPKPYRLNEVARRVREILDRAQEDVAGPARVGPGGAGAGGGSRQASCASPRRLLE